MVAFSPGGTAGRRLADRDTFADLGATVAELFGVDPPGPGRSFTADLRGR
jgi:phosphopentomutase